MPRRRIMDRLAMRDGRNRGRGRGRDRAMDEDMARRMSRDMEDMARGGRGGRGRDYNYGMDMADFEYDYAKRGGQSNYRDYAEQDMQRYPMGNQQYRQYNRDYGYMGDEHYGKTYYPIEAMGTFSGYYGMGEQDYGRYDMRGRGYYDYAGDYGETLNNEELSHWTKKLMKEVDEKDKAFFSKEHILKKAQEMGIKFDHFNEEEFIVTVLMMYTDYCKTLGSANMDIYLRLAKDWLMDEDVAVKHGEKLAVYHDCIVEGDD